MKKQYLLSLLVAVLATNIAQADFSYPSGIANDESIHLAYTKLISNQNVSLESDISFECSNGVAKILKKSRAVYIGDEPLVPKAFYPYINEVEINGKYLNFLYSQINAPTQCRLKITVTTYFGDTSNVETKTINLPITAEFREMLSTTQSATHRQTYTEAESGYSSKIGVYQVLETEKISIY